MPATPESLRFQIVIKETSKSMRAFAKKTGISLASISRMASGDQELTFGLLRSVCINLGYSPTWMILGTGNKKLKGDEVKPVTEIQMLRVEIDITAKLNLVLLDRVTDLEKRLDNLAGKTAN